VSSEGINEVLIVDLSSLPDSASVVGTVTGFTSEPHNIFVDTSMALLYVIEDFNFTVPVRILSLSNPTAPVEIGNLGGGLGTDAHDVFAQDSFLYVAEGVNGSIGIFDVRNPANPLLLKRLNIPASGYVHNVWVSEDNNYLFSTEETPGKTIKIWDIRELNNISLSGEYLGESQLAHNIMVQGNYAYMSHYESGLKIIEISDPRNPIEIGSYDTYPAGSTPNFNGSWGVYPFALGNKIFMGDMQTGLYVLKFNRTGIYRINGILKDSVTGNPILNGWIEIIESGKVVRSNGSGIFRTGHTSNEMITLKAVAFGYQEYELQLNAITGTTDSIVINLQPSPKNDLFGTLTDQNGQERVGVTVTLHTSSPLFAQPLIQFAISDINGTYSFPNLPVSDSIWIEYPLLEVGRVFPFNKDSVENISIIAASPTVINFQTDPADLLLVNDDPLGNYSELFRNNLTNLGLDPFEWNTGSDGKEIPASSIPLLRNNIVVWYTGDSNASDSILTAAAQDSLARHLDNGGKLFFTSQDLVESLSNQFSSFLANYLMVDYGGEFGGSVIINPVQSNPVGAGLGSFPAIHSSREILTPLVTGNAEAAFTYATGEVAGVTVENFVNASKIALTGFRLEKISSASIREDILDAILNWFGLTTSISQQTNQNTASGFNLFQNFPNPFNPATTIHYQIPYQEQVILTVVNLLGQEIIILVDEWQNAGTYSVTWDGRASTRIPVPSGIYLYQIEAGNFKEARKMIVIK
jgi:hypothetical protein